MSHALRFRTTSLTFAAQIKSDTLVLLTHQQLNISRGLRPMGSRLCPTFGSLECIVTREVREQQVLKSRFRNLFSLLNLIVLSSSVLTGKIQAVVLNFLT